MPVLDNPRHEMFAQQLAAGKSQSEAARLAGYSKNTARAQACRLFTNVAIQQRVEDLKDGLIERVQWSAAKVLQKLGEIVDADIAEIYDDSGNLKPLKEWPRYWRKLVTRIETETKYERSKDGGNESWDPAAAILKVHTVDRMKALELLGRHKAIDAFVAQGANAKEIAGEVMNAIDARIAEGRQRAAQARIAEKSEES